MIDYKITKEQAEFIYNVLAGFKARLVLPAMRLLESLPVLDTAAPAAPAANEQEPTE